MLLQGSAGAVIEHVVSLVECHRSGASPALCEALLHAGSKSAQDIRKVGAHRGSDSVRPGGGQLNSARLGTRCGSSSRSRSWRGIRWRSTPESDLTVQAGRRHPRPDRSARQYGSSNTASRPVSPPLKVQRCSPAGAGFVRPAAERVGPDVSFDWADDLVYGHPEHRHDGQRRGFAKCSPSYGEDKSCSRD